MTANILDTAGREAEITRLTNALRATEEALRNSRKAFENSQCNVGELMRQRDAMRIERDAAITSWTNVWRMLESEPSYQAREREAELANQVWSLQHPTATFAATGSSVALARDNA